MEQNKSGLSERGTRRTSSKISVLCGLALLWAGAGQAAPPPAGIAPVTVPAGGFGIDGDLLSGADSGDWLAGASGTGVLDASGTPLNPATTFHFVDEFNSTADQTFGGGLKWTDDPGTWTWTSSKPSAKTDINNVLLHITSDSAGHTWLVIAADRASNSGDSYIDFEFLQNPLYLTNNNKFYSLGPNGGRTANDVLLSLAFTGGGTVADFFAWRWLPNGGGGFNYVDATTALPAGRVFVAASPNNVAVPFGAFGQTTYAANAFAEAAIDLTALLGNFDSCLSIGIKTIMVKTKTSQSSTASINDFINPIQYTMRLGPSAYAGPDQTRCSEGDVTSFPLQGEAKRGMYPIVSTTWTVVDGTATIDTPSSPITTAHVGSGKATLRLTVVQEDGCTETDDIVLTVASRPVFSLSGPATLCPQSTLLFEGPEGLKGYAWTISGNGQISGANNSRQVTVAAGDRCGESFTLTLSAAGELCSSSASIDVMVNNPNPPVLTIPANLTLECPADTGTQFTGVATATDECGSPAVSFIDLVTPGPGGTKTVKRTWTAVDSCDNTVSADQIITVIDTTKPLLVCPKDLVLECADSAQTTKIAAWLASVTGSDGCGSVTFANNYDPAKFSGGCGNAGQQLVTFTATDESGNKATGTASIIIKDTTPPTIACPAPLVIEAGDPTQATRIAAWLASVKAADTCGTVTTGNDYAANKFSDGCGNTGEQTVNFTATDPCGNSATCAAKITIRDTTPPKVTPPSVAVQCPGDVPAPYADLAAFRAAGGTASDSGSSLLGFALVSDSGLVGSCPGKVTRVYWVTDECGNITESTQTIVVHDTIAPVVTCPPAVTLESGASLDPANTGSATATDNCTASLTTAYKDLVQPSQYLIKFYGADPDTNSAPYLPTYMKLAPRNLPVPESARLTGRASDPLRHAVAFDPASGKLDALTSLSGEPMVLGQIEPFEVVIEVSGSRGPEHGTIEFTAAWATHTTSNEKFGYDKDYMVYAAFVDPVDPGSIDLQRNARVESFSSVLVDDGTINEKIQGTFRISGLDSGDRVIVEIWLVLDSVRPTQVGGTIAADLVSARKLTSPPESIFTGTQTISIGNLHKIQPLPPPGQEPPAQPPLAPQPPVGAIPGTIVSVIDRTWTASDDCANQGSCVQRITVIDSTAPVMTVPPDVVLEYPADTTPTATGTAVATDLGGSVTISFSDYVEPACGPAEIISREWTAVDEFGHSMTAFQTITVVDTTAPDLSVPADVVVEYPADTSPVATGSATAVDTGGAATISYNDAVTRNGSTKTISRTWAAVDECGNAAKGLQNITVLGAPLDVVITAAPRQQNSGRGNNLLLTVSATGSEALSYQWYLNGQAIAGATDSSYRLTSLKFTDAGIYSVVVSTAEGPVVESKAVVNVLPKLSANIQREWMSVVWEGDFILQSSTRINGTYSDLPATNSSYSLSANEPCRFFRLRPKEFSIAVSHLDPGSPAALVEVTGSPGLNFVLQASTNFVDWVDLATGTAPFSYLDTNSQSAGLRLYRVQPLPDSAPPNSSGPKLLPPQAMSVTTE